MKPPPFVRLPPGHARPTLAPAALATRHAPTTLCYNVIEWTRRPFTLRDGEHRDIERESNEREPNQNR